MLDVLDRCVLLVSLRKLQFFESEDANMSTQLELAGARIRSVTMPEGSEPQFVFEIYTPRWDRTLEALACTSKRDLQQWMRAFTEFMTEGGALRAANLANLSASARNHLTQCVWI